MENKRKHFEDIEVILPILVVKFGLVWDGRKDNNLEDLWKEAETEVLKIMPTFVAGDLFFEELVIDGYLTYSFRYYTPGRNIKNKTK